MTRRELEITDREEICSILDRTKILHLGLVDDGMPYIVPMNYGYQMDEAGHLELYLHSSVKGYKMEVIRRNPVCCFELECGVLPFEGELPCQYGTAYSSVMGRGRLEIVEDPAEKMDLMSRFMKSQTGKDFSFNEKLVSIVSVLRLRCSEYTAKCRPLPAKLREAACEEEAE